MKKNYILGITLLTSVGFLAMQQTGAESIEDYLPQSEHLNKFSGGATAGNTGAPGESNCITCHTGNVQDGSGLNNLLVLDGATTMTNYTPGTTYNVSLALNSGDVMEGFQATVLDVSTNTMAGSFPGTGGLGTVISSGSGRDYANHTSSSNTEGNFAWIWEWNAPATDVGPVTFYVCTNIANGDGSTAGDVIYLSQHTLGSTGNNSIEELNIDANFNAGYSPAANDVKIDFDSKSIGNMYFNLVDLTGKSTYSVHLGESELGENKLNVSIPDEIANGIYVVNFFVGNKAMSKKIMVQK